MAHKIAETILNEGRFTSLQPFDGSWNHDESDQCTEEAATARIALLERNQELWEGVRQVLGEIPDPDSWKQPVLTDCIVHISRILSTVTKKALKPLMDRYSHPKGAWLNEKVTALLYNGLTAARYEIAVAAEEDPYLWDMIQGLEAGQYCRKSRIHSCTVIKDSRPNWSEERWKKYQEECDLKEPSDAMSTEELRKQKQVLEGILLGEEHESTEEYVNSCLAHSRILGSIATELGRVPVSVLEALEDAKKDKSGCFLSIQEAWETEEALSSIDFLFRDLVWQDTRWSELIKIPKAYQ